MSENGEKTSGCIKQINHIHAKSHKARVLSWFNSTTLTTAISVSTADEEIHEEDQQLDSPPISKTMILLRELGG